MDKYKQRQEVSLVGRILSMEALLFLMGVASLFYGIVKGELFNVLWGAIIIGVVLLLMKLRRKDLNRHREDIVAVPRAGRGGAKRKETGDERGKH